MKLQRLVVEGFRGVPTKAELPLPPEGACILAENGQGKTTFVDALDILTSGDLKQYHREGYGLDSVVNIDAPSARISCETSTGERFSRLIERTGVEPLTVEGGRGATRTFVPPIPILRHRTMTELMERARGKSARNSWNWSVSPPWRTCGRPCGPRRTQQPATRKRPSDQRSANGRRFGRSSVTEKCSHEPRSFGSRRSLTRRLSSSPI